MTKRHIRRLVSAMLALAVLVAASVIPPVTASAEGTTYYVASADGSDSNDGKSQSKPWKSLDKVNSTEFQPGDKILFKCGSLWSGQLWPKGSGTEGKPIVLDQYGKGNKPLFNGQGMEKPVVYLYNQQYWEINNLEITNNARTTGARLGVEVLGVDAGVLNYIHIKGLYIHHIKGGVGNNYEKDKMTGGIGIKVLGNKVPTKFNDVLVENCTLKSLDRNGIWTHHTWADRGGIDYTSGPWFPHTKVVVRNNALSDIGGDAIVVRHSDAPLIEHNVVDGASMRADGANDGIWPRNTDDAVVQYNEVFNMNLGSADGKAYDADWNGNRTIIQYNYSHENEGGFVLICCFSEHPEAFTDGTIIRYNISQNDLLRTFELTGRTTNTKIYNNVIYLRDTLVAGVAPVLMIEDNGVWPSNTYWYNNIFFNEGMKQWFFGESTNNVFDNNCWFSDYDEYAWDQPKDAHKLIADPQFINPGNAGKGWDAAAAYKLKPTSPCINRGKVIEDNGGKDYFGNKLYKDAPDIGAFEYQGEVPPVITVKGKSVTLKYTPEFSGKTILAYPGDLANHLGAKYSYNARTKAITITRGKTVVKMTAGSSTAYVGTGKYTMPAPVKLKTVPLVPLQFLVEKLGYKYSYNASTKTAAIK